MVDSVYAWARCALAGIVVVAVAAIVFFTLVNVFNVKPLVNWCKAPRRYTNILFTSLVLQLVALGVTSGRWILDDAKELQETRTELKLGLEEWVAASRAWMNEPSGLSLCGLRGGAETPGPVLVSVDDEESAVFVLRVPREGDSLVVRSMLWLMEKRENKVVALEVNDLEGVTHAGDNLYYAVTSHRQLGEGKPERTRRLLKFTVDPTGWQNPPYEVIVQGDDDLTALNPGPSIGKFLRGQFGRDFIPQAQWLDPLPEKHPQRYALEIEGLAYWRKRLYMGLKWPLHQGNALLLEYDPEQKGFTDVHELDLGGHGISNLTVHEDWLIVASNPPQKGAYGQSRLTWFSVGDGGELAEVGASDNVRKSGVKLGGVAVQKDQVFLTYDGDDRLSYLKVRDRAGVGLPPSGGAR